MAKQAAPAATPEGASLLVRHARLVPLGQPAGAGLRHDRPGRAAGPALGSVGRAPARHPEAPPPSVGRTVDLRLVAGRVAEAGPGLRSRGEPELDVEGGWVIPGLWDQHVHVAQAVKASTWFDVGGAPSAAAAVARVAAHLDSLPADLVATTPVTGFGFRLNAWSDAPSVAALDAVAGTRPVVLISGDAHTGWLNTAAQTLLGTGPFAGAVSEGEWFPLFDRLDEVPDLRPDATAFAHWLDAASARGITGLVDVEFRDAFAVWPARVAAGLKQVRVRAAVYPHQLDEVLARGLRSGDALEASGLITLGPLKIITDGSLGSRTAWCCAPYAGAPDSGAGAPNLPPQELRAWVATAVRHGLEVALHGIGDRACQAVLDAVEATGARGSVEHAQLLRDADVPRFARLGVAASVQPLHLLDDRDAAERLWGAWSRRCFRFRDLLDAGADVRFGSDAPIAPVDPWGAMAAAVHRSGDDRQPWHPEQALSAQEALRCSVDGRRLSPGEPADLVVLGDDPLRPFDTTADVAAHLRHLPVLATVCAGRLTHRDPTWGATP